MHIALFGATGKLGREIIEQALAAGHEVTALVYDSARLKLEADKLYKVIGSVSDGYKVEETVACADAVIYVLGASNNEPGDMVTGAEHIIAAMQKRGMSRLIVVSALGVGDSKDQLSRSARMLLQTVHKKSMAEKAAAEAVVRQSGLDWVILRPSPLTKGPLTGEYQASVDKSLVGSQISRADAAQFALQQLTDDTWLWQTVVITY